MVRLRERGLEGLLSLLHSQPESQRWLPWTRAISARPPLPHPWDCPTQISNLRLSDPLHLSQLLVQGLGRPPASTPWPPSISIAALSDFAFADTSNDESPVNPVATTPRGTFYSRMGIQGIMRGYAPPRPRLCSLFSHSDPIPSIKCSLRPLSRRQNRPTVAFSIPTPPQILPCLSRQDTF
jgi:hypothetical protein